jgi:hypothetical protein
VIQVQPWTGRHRFVLSCICSSVLAVAIMALAGCGQAPPAATSTANSAAATTTKDSGTTAEASAKPAKSKTSENGGANESEGTASASRSVRTDASGRKWIGDIPYDVFFDDPLAVVADSSSIKPPAAGEMTNAAAGSTTAPPAANSDAATESPSSPSTTPSETAASTPGEGPAWHTIVSVDHIQTEVKRIRNHLKTSLQTQGTYNGNAEAIRIDGAVLAALAGIMQRHAEQTSWKPNAKYIRAFGQDLLLAAQQLGKADYTKSQEAGEKIEAVFSGNVPGDAGDPPAEQSFGESASRWGVMKRISMAHEMLRSNITTAAKLKSESEAVLQETAMLWAMAVIAADRTYESAEEPDYQQWAQDLIAGSKDMHTAAQEQSFEAFRAGIDKTQKACQDCHNSYGTQ